MNLGVYRMRNLREHMTLIAVEESNAFILEKQDDGGVVVHMQN